MEPLASNPILPKINCPSNDSSPMPSEEENSPKRATKALMSDMKTLHNTIVNNEDTKPSIKPFNLTSNLTTTLASVKGTIARRFGSQERTTKVLGNLDFKSIKKDRVTSQNSRLAQEQMDTDK